MKRQRLRSRPVWVIVLLASLASVPALAGDEKKPDAKPDKSKRIAEIVNKPQLLYGNAFDVRGLSATERTELGVYRYETHLRLLHESMVRELKLTDLQKSVIAGIVEERITLIHETGGAPTLQRRPEPGEQPTAPGGQGNSKVGLKNPGTPAGPVNLRQPPAPTMYDDPMPLMELLAAELSGEQTPRYWELAKRWKALRPRGASDGPIRQLVRAVRDPELDVDDGARASYDRIIRTSLKQLGRNRMSFEKRYQTFQDAKTEIKSTMSPAQAKHLETTLKMLQERHADEILMVMDMRAKEKTKAEKAAKEARAKKAEAKKAEGKKAESGKP